MRIVVVAFVIGGCSDRKLEGIGVISDRETTVESQPVSTYTEIGHRENASFKTENHSRPLNDLNITTTVEPTSVQDDIVSSIGSGSENNSVDDTIPISSSSSSMSSGSLVSSVSLVSLEKPVDGESVDPPAVDDGDITSLLPDFSTSSSDGSTLADDHGNEAFTANGEPFLRTLSGEAAFRDASSASSESLVLFDALEYIRWVQRARVSV
jgi:hypothetical protein